MAMDRNLPPQGRGAFRTEYRPGKGYLVLDPDGNPAGGITPFRTRADQLRDRLQRDADAKAKRGPRGCMCCGATFVSEGIHHRLCASCRSRSDGGSMAVSATSNGKVRRAARA